MSKYRTYALIHGETLPTGKIFDCEIKKMSFDEQERRKFSPIQSVFSEEKDVNYYKTYVTSLRYVDPILIKSEYVITHNIEEDDPGGALGGSIKEIDRVCRFLSLACLEDVKRKFGRNRGSFEPYIYQINKIYLLDEKGNESDVNFKLKSGHIYLPNRPEFTEWRDSDTTLFLDEIYSFHDEILERALKYLYRSSIGYLVLDSKEKIALDHFKSIEIIINSLSKKHTFKQRLKEACSKIGISPEEEKRINDFWSERSTYGDVAHVSPFDQAERYPNQFPIPSNVQYSGGGFDSVAANIIIKYFQYIKGVFTIDIEELSNQDGSDAKESTFTLVYSIGLWGTFHHNHLYFNTSEKNKNKLKDKLKKSFAEFYKIPKKSIVEVTPEPNKNKNLKRKRFKLRINMEA